MNILYIISQIFGTLSFVISLVAYHRGTKKKIFQTMMVANILDILHYLCLSAYSGFITKVLALVRNKIIIVKEKNKKLNNNIVLVVIMVTYLITGILTYKNIYSILPILAAMIYFYFVWNGNEIVVKKAGFWCYFLWLAYNICVLSVAGIVSNIVSIVSTYIAVYVEVKKDKKGEQKNEKNNSRSRINSH